MWGSLFSNKLRPSGTTAVLLIPERYNITETALEMPLLFLLFKIRIYLLFQF